MKFGSGILTLSGALVLLATFFAAGSTWAEANGFQSRFETIRTRAAVVAAGKARTLTDRVIAIAMKDGKELLPNQKVVAYDLFYERAKYEELLKRLPSVRPEPQIIWLKADQRSGTTQLLKWMGELENPALRSYLLSQNTNFARQDAAANRLVHEIMGLALRKKLLVLDDITGDPQVIGKLIADLKGLQSSSVIFIIDQNDLLEKLKQEAPKPFTRLTVVDGRATQVCQTDLAGAVDP